MGDAVWIKSPHGRCTTQFDRGTVMRIYSPLSVCVDGIPHHVKDVHPVYGKNNTTSDHVTPLDPSDDEADSIVYKAAEENSSASSVSCGLRQDEFSDTSKDNATKDTESVPLRWSSEQEPEVCTPEATSETTQLRWSGWKKNNLLNIVLYVIPRSGRSVMIMNMISVKNLFIEEARTLGLLVFFTIAEWVTGEAHNIVVNPKWLCACAAELTARLVLIMVNSIYIKGARIFHNSNCSLRHKRVQITCCESRSRRGKDLDTNQQDTHAEKMEQILLVYGFSKETNTAIMRMFKLRNLT